MSVDCHYWNNGHSPLLFCKDHHRKDESSDDASDEMSQRVRSRLGRPSGKDVEKQHRRSCARGSAMRSSEATPSILTVGHSTRTLEDFTRLLESQGVKLVVDVRTIPRSKRNPQFNQESLPGSLRTSGIDYVHLKELGGLRRFRE
jgi:hypothetical protein